MTKAPNENGLMPNRDVTPTEGIEKTSGTGPRTDFKLTHYQPRQLTKQLQPSQFPFKGRG